MKIKQAMLLAYVMLIPGCATVGPHYHRPYLKVPCRFDHSDETTRVGDLCNWWQAFNDTGLDCLIAQAVNHNYSLRAAFEKIQELRWNYNIKTAELLPEIDAFGFILRNRYSTDIPFFTNTTQNPGNLLGLGVATLWELDVWGRLRKAQSAALADYRAQIEATRDVYIMLLADVAELYISLRALEIKIEIRKKQVAIDKELLALSQDLFHAGLFNAIPPEIQLQSLLESENYILVLEKMAVQTQNSLAALMSENIADFCLPAGSGIVPLSNGMLKTGIPSELLRRRPDIREAEQKLIAANEHIGQAIGDFFPKFSLVGLVSSLSSTFKAWFSGSSLAWAIGPAFSWPLITFGRITFEVRSKKAVYRQALYTYAQTVIEAFSDVENNLVNYFTQAQTLALSEKKLASIEKERALTECRFRAGLIDRLQYLYVEKQTLAIKLETIENQKELSTALVRVYKALGGGWNCD